MAETWEELENNCSRCQGCNLYIGRKHVVFGRGNREALLMFVGEGPGRNEDEQGVPFVGQAGRLFDLALAAAGFSNGEYYITNVVKCRPPENRTPTADECRVCMFYLRKQYRMINPKIVVCLGNVAAQNLIDPEAKISSLRGQWITKGNAKFTATYHPAALLRDESKKLDFFKDMQEIKKQLDAELMKL